MNEIVVDHGQIVARWSMASSNCSRMRTSAAVPPGARLSRRNSSSRRGSLATVQFGRRFVGRRLPPLGDGAIDAGAIVAECGGERFEKGDARPGRELGIARQDFLRQRDAGRLAAAGQQLLALFDQTRRTLMRRFPALALDQCAAAVGDALQHLAEERGVHRFIPSGKH